VTQAVIKVKASDLQRVKQMILRSKHADLLDTSSEYEAFRIKCDGETIIAYTSGKIVCSGSRAEALAQTAVRSLDDGEAKEGFVIGSDEAGKGEWLGPLVVAAVAVSVNQSRALQSLGVMDSKDVQIKRLGKLAVEIESGCSGKSVLLVPPETFNIRFKEMRNEGKNLNDLLAWGHAKVVSEVYSSITSESKIRVVIDEFARDKTRQRLARVVPLDKIDLIQRPRAEDEIAVAAASILAREAREQWIDQYSSRMKIDLRELSVPEALAHPDSGSFSKTEYLQTLSRRRQGT
jgi:ribonuclease HIII